MNNSVAPTFRVPEPRAAGTSSWSVAASLVRAGLLVTGGLALLALVAWPEEHRLFHYGQFWGGNSDPVGLDAHENPRCDLVDASFRVPDSRGMMLFRYDSPAVLVRRIESIFAPSAK